MDDKKERVNKRLGLVCWENLDFAVRIRLDGEGALRVVVHRKVTEQEIVPGSYIPGVTSLVLDKEIK